MEGKVMSVRGSPEHGQTLSGRGELAVGGDPHRWNWRCRRDR